MRRFLFFIVIFVLAVWVGVTVAKDPGYALFVYQQWSIEMPLWLCMVVVVLAFFIFYVLISLVFKANKIREHFEAWRHNTKREKAHDSLTQGLIALVEQQWHHAEKLLANHPAASEVPVVHHLLAAQAANKVNAHERCEDHLKCAEALPGYSKVAVNLLRAQFLCETKQFSQAALVLKEILRSAPHHEGVLFQLSEVHVALGEWSALEEMLPTLRKYHVRGEQCLDFETRVYQALLHVSKEVAVTWKRIPRSVKKHPGVLGAYANHLIQENEGPLAMKVIAEGLSRHYDDTLMQLYGECPGDLDAQYKQALLWLKKYPNRPEVWLVLAKLASRLEIHGQAREYFEKYMASVSVSAEGRKAYAKFLVSQGLLEEAVGVLSEL